MSYGVSVAGIIQLIFVYLYTKKHFHEVHSNVGHLLYAISFILQYKKKFKAGKGTFESCQTSAIIKLGFIHVGQSNRAILRI